jgi:hypothetical protein
VAVEFAETVLSQRTNDSYLIALMERWMPPTAGAAALAAQRLAPPEYRGSGSDVGDRQIHRPSLVIERHHQFRKQGGSGFESLPPPRKLTSVCALRRRVISL